MPQSDNHILLSEDEISFSAIRAQGAGGQNVNKVSSAVHLRFDINASSLSDFQKKRLLNCTDHRISKDGIIIIKAQQYRTQEKNREDAITRLRQLIQRVCKTQKTRRATKPSRNSQKKRMDKKKLHGRIKALRGRVTD